MVNRFNVAAVVQDPLIPKRNKNGRTEHGFLQALLFYAIFCWCRPLGGKFDLFALQNSQRKKMY